MLRLPLRGSIGAKIFGAFIAISLITALLGGYGFYVLSQAGNIVVDTYDRPLMAINYARSASLTFALMENQLLRRSSAAPADRTAIDRNLDSLTVSFFEDLDVARQRSLAADEDVLIRQIKDLVSQWNQWRQGLGQGRANGELTELSKQIGERFDLLIEMNTGLSFVERRKAIWAISRFETLTVAASLLALCLSAAITLLLARRIVRPLTAAAVVADRIARGELQAPIPEGGQDETGILLRSMKVMQDNIRAMIEREIAERRSAQRRFADALENAREAMMLVDADGKIVRANSQIADFFPAVADRLVEGADFADVFSEVERQIAGAKRTYGGEPLSALGGEGAPLASGGEFRLADGRWIHVSRSPTRDGGFFLFVSNFTEIKRREERYREAKKQAEAASVAKTRFLANMSHELRTPLNAIIGFSEIISRELIGRLENRQYVHYAKDILESGSRLLEIINNVLDLAKSEAGELMLNAEEVDLGAVLSACAQAVTAQCTSAQLEFTALLPECPVIVHGERPKLRQIFLSLLSNAIKFSKPGGKVTMSATVSGDARVRVDVADTGIGMRPEDVPLALSAFGQIDNSLARRFEGAGLGLPLIKALVALHGGTMAIDSALDRGTTVSVMLPTRTAARASSSPVARAS
ncbi:MAG: ATP-binding protein [Alphaproteobacteria bacterium]